MKIKPSFNKIIVSLLVVSALLLTAFTVKAASLKSIPEKAASAAISAISVEKASSSTPKLFSQILDLSTAKAGTSASDDRGGQSAELTSNSDEASSLGEDTEDDTESEISSTDSMDSSDELTENDQDTSNSSEDEQEPEGGNENSNAQMGNRVVLFGQLTAVNGDTWTVNGKAVLVSSSTRVLDNPQVGNMVMVLGTLESNSSIQASQVKLFTTERKSSHDESGSPFRRSNSHGDGD